MYLEKFKNDPKQWTPSNTNETNFCLQSKTIWINHWGQRPQTLNRPLLEEEQRHRFQCSRPLS